MELTIIVEHVAVACSETDKKQEVCLIDRLIMFINYVSNKAISL